jgi:CARDB/PKD domain
MMSYLHSLCRERKRSRLVQVPLIAALLFYALVPLTNDAVLAQMSGSRPLAAAPRERPVLMQRQVPEPAGPKALIAPTQITVTQGERATFTSRSLADPDVPIVNLQWIGPARQNSRDNRFVVETVGLQPGPYEVRLTVSDKRERRSQAVATLVVNPPGNRGSGTSDGVSGESRPPLARINPERREVRQGEPARFVSVSRPSDPRGRIIDHAWTTQWGQRSAGEILDVDTRGLPPGRYALRLEVTDQSKHRAASAATLVVFPPSVSPPPPNPPGPGSKSSPSQAPIAKITPEYREVDQGEVAFFDGRQSRDPDGKILHWSWQMDNEPLGERSSVDINAGHLSPGRHRVLLRVTDNQGLTAVDSATLIVRQRVREVDVALVDLYVSPPEVPPNRPVQITAVVANQGKDEIRNVKVRFEIGGALLTETFVPALSSGGKSAVNARWVATSPGEHIVAARVDPENRTRDVNQTNNGRTRAVLVRSQPAVAVTPNPLQVDQGEKAEFVSRVTFSEGRSDQSLRYLWRGPGARIGHGSSFQLDTGDIRPGKHQISLEISDGRGSIATAAATLVVTERPLALWLTADTQNPETGQIVKFTGGTKPSFSDTEYKFLFGDGKETDWSATPEAAHSYEEPRNYSIGMTVRRAGVIAGQTSTGIDVKETPYSVILTSEPESVRAGRAVTFTVRVEPPSGDVEYQFRFGDGQETSWTRAATTTHSFSRDGTYAATAAIRLRGTRVVQSPATNIRVLEPRNPIWSWLGVAAAVIAAAAAGFVWRRSPQLPPAVSIVPRVDLASLTVATSGQIDSNYAFGIRAARGEYRCRIELDGALVNG